MSDLSKNARAAAAMGLSYGKYKALTYNPDQERKSPSKSHRKPQKGKRYSEQEAFNLWQEGKTDEEIASVFGVSRTLIQRWRDTMELPSTSKRRIDTKKYRLEQNPDGTYVVLKETMANRKTQQRRSYEKQELRK